MISRKGPYRCPAQYNNNQLAKKLERERESDGLTFQQGPMYINKKNTIQCDIFHTITNLSYISAGCPKRKLDFAFFSFENVCDRRQVFTLISIPQR